MSDKILKGKFTANYTDLQNIFRWSVAPFEDTKDKTWFNLSEERLVTVSNSGESVLSYCTFTEPFIEDVETHESVNSEAGLECIFAVDYTLDMLHFVGGDEVTIEFYGYEDERGCREVVFDGSLQGTIYPPHSDADYKKMKLSTVYLFDDEERFVKPSSFELGQEDPSSGEALSTSFTTEVSEFEKIVEAEEFDNFSMSNYPVVIDDGNFYLEAQDSKSNDAVRGNLFCEDFEGEDVSNTYSRSFDKLFSEIRGTVEVQIEQDSPISIVKENNDESMTLRYVIMPAY